MRPGIEPTSSWILVRFVTTVPQQEPPVPGFKHIFKIYSNEYCHSWMNCGEFIWYPILLAAVNASPKRMKREFAFPLASIMAKPLGLAFWAQPAHSSPSEVGEAGLSQRRSFMVHSGATLREPKQLSLPPNPSLPWSGRAGEGDDQAGVWLSPEEVAPERRGPLGKRIECLGRIYWSES